MNGRRVDAYELSDDFRDAVREAEVAGGRTVVMRGDLPVAVVVSHDEYVALRETVTIAGDERLRAAIAQAESECAAGDFYLPEELLDEPGRFGNDRLRLSATASGSVRQSLVSSRDVVRRFLAQLDDDPAGGVPLFDPMRPLWCRHDSRFRAVYRVATEGRILFVLTLEAVGM